MAKLCHPHQRVIPFTLNNNNLLRKPTHLNLTSSSFKCNNNSANLSSSITTSVKEEPSLVFASVKTFAPATVANLGPGFDFLGCAVDGIGDYVTLKVDPTVHPGQVSISDISGSNSLSKNPLYNCADLNHLTIGDGVVVFGEVRATMTADLLVVRGEAANLLVVRGEAADLLVVRGEAADLLVMV